MQAFRDMIKGWVGKVLLGIIIVLFVFMGAEALLGVLNAPQPIASVNGDDISQQELARGMDIQRRNMLSRMGENADPSLIDDGLLRKNVVDTLVDRLLMKQAVGDSNLAVSTASINAAIMDIPAFQRDGQFSQELFERLVIQSGFGPKQFIQEVGYDLIVAQLKNGIAGSAFATTGELKKLISIEKQTRDVALLTVKHQKYKGDIEVSEDEISSYYDENQQSYKTKEKIRVDYISLKAKDFNRDVDITDQEIEAQFRILIEGLEAQEERKASHIMVEITDLQDESAAKAKIEGVKSKLDAGGDFVSLAKEFSEDSGSKDSGGDLGFARKGVNPIELEEAIFAMDKGQVSEIVETEYGFHIVKLDDIKAAELPVIADKKDDIEKQLKTQKAEDLYYEKIEELRDVAFESGDLDAPAEMFDKRIQHTSWINRTGNKGVFKSNKITAALFEDEVLLDGNNTEVLEISSTESIVARVVEHKPASIKPLDKVSGAIKEVLIVRKAAEAAKSTGEEIVAKLKEGVSTSDIESSYDLKWKVVAEAKRRSPELGFVVAQHAFKMPKAAADEKSIDGINSGNDFSVIVVTAVKDGEYDLSDTEEAQMRKFIANQFGSAEFNDYVRNKRNDASIDIRKPKS